MSLTVREKYLWQQLSDEKQYGMGAWHGGQIFHVVPGASATHFAYVTNRHKNVYTSVSAALADCVATRGDVIVVYSGTHTFTASLAMSKADVSVVSSHQFFPNIYGDPAILDITGTNDELINFTAANCKLIGLTLRGTTQQVCVDASAAANNLLLKYCNFDMQTPAVHTSTKGFAALGAATNVRIENCGVECDGAQGNWIIATALLQSTIKSCEVKHTAGTWASTILCGAATKGLLIEDNDFDSYGTAITACINGTGATIASGVVCKLNRFGNLCTVPIDNFDAGECEIDRNYKADVGAAAGGTLITAIT